MNLNRYVFKPLRELAFTAALAFASMPVCAGEVTPVPTNEPAPDSIPTLSKYERRIMGWQALAQSLIPDMSEIQYAGGIGMISAGVGWDYGRSNQWETHLMFGYIPGRYNYHHYWTFTLRESYIPWRIHVTERWNVCPLSVNLSVNSILHGDFWASEPDRYPKGYYVFPTRVRLLLGLSQRITYRIPRNKRFMSSEVSFYYEISTCDTYIRQKVKMPSLPLKELIVLGAGIIWKI